MTKVMVIFLILGLPEVLFARPEYALKNNIINCTVCHASPTGGGIRNITGKLYGSHGYKLSQFSEKAQWFQLDYRMEGIQTKSTATRKGLLTMTTTPAVNVPLQFDENAPASMNFVSSYGLGRLDTGLGYTYIRYNIHPESGIAWIEHVLVGRINVPYGLMTDEHRNFTKISVPSSLRDIETGFLISGTPKYSFHYDFAATNGTQGDTPVVDDSPWALYFNTRFMPYLGPLMMGASYSRHGTSKVPVQPEAYNLYGLFSIEKLSSNRIPITLLSEIEWAHGWNNALVNPGMSNFVPASMTTWQSALDNSRSNTLLLETDWNISPTWIALYRFEQFIPETQFTADKFNRHSYGMKWFLNGQSSLLVRYEHGYSTKPGFTNDVKSVGNNAFFLFHFWL
jgi:hypothetical protein